MPYLTSIGVDLDFLEDPNDVSPDPMNDLIDEAFDHPISLSLIPMDRATPISRWEIDWSRPLPKTTHAYWEMIHVSSSPHLFVLAQRSLQRTRPKPAHEFTRTKPVVGAPRVNPQPYCHQEKFPQYYDFEDNVHNTSRKLRTVLHKVRGFVTSR